jgi:hypothetical protein
MKFPAYEHQVYSSYPTLQWEDANAKSNKKSNANTDPLLKNMGSPLVFGNKTKQGYIPNI